MFNLMEVLQWTISAVKNCAELPPLWSPVDLAAVQSAEEVANSRMAINTDNEIYSCHALDAMDRAAVAAADMVKAIVAAASF